MFIKPPIKNTETMQRCMGLYFQRKVWFSDTNFSPYWIFLSLKQTDTFLNIQLSKCSKPGHMKRQYSNVIFSRGSSLFLAFCISISLLNKLVKFHVKAKAKLNKNCWYLQCHCFESITHFWGNQQLTSSETSSLWIWFVSQFQYILFNTS
jgi:hypothetical protein